MENPAQEISGVIHLLTQTTPSEQRETIDTYFTHNASFTHPFCRTGSWDNSRLLIHAIYRWYKIMSPKIDLTVHSVAYDEQNLTLYVNLSQVFRIWVIPFYYAPVNLVTMLKLKHNRGNGKYYIDSQNDLYQVDQFVRFFVPGGWILVCVWHALATFFCLIGAIALWPVTVIEEWVGKGSEQNGSLRQRKDMGGIDFLNMERKSIISSN
ncbi:hypothetical protein P154DRAFT_11340 [Amniculicola lignicola CBS 123094]|uniref:SigF-like NTF2-like domain-containing protein n=1 Tax=Amniculicola lignicola CBS 123094 TaxID=1392246 RepID=A0A6A5X511_9PLEO|nr:hypothetical protein P154DRAFT_11340 [Amniculicola lignicola CBS 123094]